MYDPDRRWVSSEDLLADAIGPLMDTHDEVLAFIADQCRRVLDDGGPDAMRACLSSIMVRLIDIASLDDSDASKITGKV
jgi:hypothetical protein